MGGKRPGAGPWVNGCGEAGAASGGCVMFGFCEGGDGHLLRHRDVQVIQLAKKLLGRFLRVADQCRAVGGNGLEEGAELVFGRRAPVMSVVQEEAAVVEGNAVVAQTAQAAEQALFRGEISMWEDPADFFVAKRDQAFCEQAASGAVVAADAGNAVWKPVLPDCKKQCACVLQPLVQIEVWVRHCSVHPG